MKIEIELKEFWLEEESELEPALKQHVIFTAVQQINQSIKDRVEKHVDAEVKRQVEENMYKLINSHIKTCIEKDTVKSRYGKDDVTIEEWIKEVFSRHDVITPVNDNIKRIAANMAIELKQRYDLLFASQLVSKMHENQMLKDDVARLLLENKDGK